MWLHRAWVPTQADTALAALGRGPRGGLAGPGPRLAVLCTCNVLCVIDWCVQRSDVQVHGTTLLLFATAASMAAALTARTLQTYPLSLSTHCRGALPRLLLLSGMGRRMRPCAPACQRCPDPGKPLQQRPGSRQLLPCWRPYLHSPQLPLHRSGGTPTRSGRPWQSAPGSAQHRGRPPQMPASLQRCAAAPRRCLAAGTPRCCCRRGCPVPAPPHHRTAAGRRGGVRRCAYGPLCAPCAPRVAASRPRPRPCRSAPRQRRRVGLRGRLEPVTLLQKCRCLVSAAQTLTRPPVAAAAPHRRPPVGTRSPSGAGHRAPARRPARAAPLPRCKAAPAQRVRLRAHAALHGPPDALRGAAVCRNCCARSRSVPAPVRASHPPRDSCLVSDRHGMAGPAARLRARHRAGCRAPRAAPHLPRTSTLPPCRAHVAAPPSAVQLPLGGRPLGSLPSSARAAHPPHQI